MLYLIAGLILSGFSALFAVKGLGALRPRGGEDRRTLLSAAYLSAVVVISSLAFLSTDGRLVISVVGTHMGVLVMSVLAIVSAILTKKKSMRTTMVFVSAFCTLVIGIMCFSQYMPFVTGTALMLAISASVVFGIYGWTQPQPGDSEGPANSLYSLLLILPLVLTPVAALMTVEGGTDIMGNQYFLSICFVVAVMIAVIPAFVSMIRRSRARASAETATVCTAAFCGYVVIGSYILPLVMFI